MLRSHQIPSASIPDWRKLAQGLHARFRVQDLSAAAAFVTAIAHETQAADHPPRIVIGAGHVDLELVSPDAVYRADDGSEFIVEWVTQVDVDLARTISDIAARLGLEPDPTAVSELELGLDTAASERIAPMWAQLLTGDPMAQGRGTPGDEVRDATVRVPNLWFGDDAPADRAAFHVEVYVAPEAVGDRVAAVVAAGGRIVDDSESPGMTVVADQDGNRGVICADVSAAAGSSD